MGTNNNSPSVVRVHMVQDLHTRSFSGPWIYLDAYRSPPPTIRVPIDVGKVFESEPRGAKRRQGWPRQRWSKHVDENLTTLGIQNWRQASTARDVWCRKLAEAKTCNRPNKAKYLNDLLSLPL